MSELSIQTEQVSQLVPVTDRSIGNDLCKTVNARDLHAFLDVKRDFSTWVKDQIERARLVKGRDYTSVPIKGDAIINDLAGLRPGLDYTIEYHLTLDAGKHVGMISGTDKGFDIREYFIECERKLKSAQIPDFSDPAKAARAWADAYEESRRVEAERKKLEQRIEQDRPMTEIGRLISAEDAMTRREWVNLIKEEHGIKVKEKAVTQWLLDEKYCYRDQLTGETRAYAQHDHLFKLAYERINGVNRPLLKITGEGIRTVTPRLYKHFKAKSKELA